MVVLVFAVCAHVDGHDRVCANRKRDGWEDRVRIFVRSVESVCDCASRSLCATLAMGRQPECKCVWDLPYALRVCHLDSVRGAALDTAGSCEGHCSIAGHGGNQLDDGSASEAEQADCASGLVQCAH